MSNTAARRAAGRRARAGGQDEIVRINTEARPFALQVALLVPLIAGLLGLVASFAMARLPDIKPKASLEGLAFD